MVHNIQNDTPIAMLTVGQLREVLGINEKQEPQKVEQPKRYVYGLAGIKKLFHVSHVTAQRYKDTILADAVSQQGRVIMTDVEKAIELFQKAKNKS